MKLNRFYQLLSVAEFKVQFMHLFLITFHYFDQFISVFRYICIAWYQSHVLDLRPNEIERRNIKEIYWSFMPKQLFPNFIFCRSIHCNIMMAIFFHFLIKLEFFICLVISSWTHLWRVSFWPPAECLFYSIVKIWYVYEIAVPVAIVHGSILFYYLLLHNIFILSCI